MYMSLLETNCVNLNTNTQQTAQSKPVLRTFLLLIVRSSMEPLALPFATLPTLSVPPDGRESRR